MTQKLKHSPVVPLILGLGLFAAACGPAATPAPTTAPAAQPTTAPAPAAQPTQAATTGAGKPVKGGTLTVATQRDATTFDPTKSQDVYSNDIISLVCDT